MVIRCDKVSLRVVGLRLSESDLKTSLINSLDFLLLLILSWCVMTFTHELGHIITGCCSGGHLQKWDLAPWRLPYSFFDPNPHPLLTLWGGPILGAVIPCVVATVWRSNRGWFVAYFCVLANGIYLLLAWWSGERFLDTPQLLEQGASRFSVGLFCLVTISMGYIGIRKTCMLLLTRNTKRT